MPQEEEDHHHVDYDTNTNYIYNHFDNYAYYIGHGIPSSNYGYDYDQETLPTQAKALPQAQDSQVPQASFSQHRKLFERVNQVEVDRELL